MARNLFCNQGMMVRFLQAARKEKMHKLNFDGFEIKVLSTMEAIRKRPTMYVGILEDPKLFTKLIIEAMCLSRARAVDGQVTDIIVSLTDNNEVTISDNGCGMSMEPHIKYLSGAFGDKSLLEKLLTELHACKNIKHDDIQSFCENGIVVVNALSEYFSVTNKINNLAYIIRYVEGELEKSPYISHPVTHEGLVFNFKFDPKIFGELKVDRKHLIAEIEKIKIATPINIELVFDN